MSDIFVLVVGLAAIVLLAFLFFATNEINNPNAECREKYKVIKCIRISVPLQVLDVRNE